MGVWSTGATTITLNSFPSLSVGMKVEGSGFAADTYIAAGYVTGSTVVPITKPTIYPSDYDDYVEFTSYTPTIINKTTSGIGTLRSVNLGNVTFTTSAPAAYWYLGYNSVNTGNVTGAPFRDRPSLLAVF